MVNLFIYKQACHSCFVIMYMMTQRQIEQKNCHLPHLTSFKKNDKGSHKCSNNVLNPLVKIIPILLCFLDENLYLKCFPI